MTPHHVVVGVDGSLNAVRALDWASDEAARRGAALRVVHAVPDRDEAEPVLSSAAARVRERHPDLSVEVKAMEGGTVRALLRESEASELTVVGTRGLAGATALLAGSVSLRLAAHVHGPLLVVRGDHACDGERTVLLGLEDDSDADAASYAFAEAERRGARLRVVHSTHRYVTPELPSLIPGTSPGQRRRAQNDLAEDAVPRFNLARLRDEHPEVGVETRTVRRGAARALLDDTRESAVVVIGARRRSSRLGPQLGPVAHTLLRSSHCPVVLVPTAG
ncbi:MULTISPECIES: universal stress protein [Streptomyces]|uniref:universal stress protein n=1 Tax=Streptomyces TaxID=1883 RepID=UPI00163C9D5A|nr:universal stress protein [Streptomyces sp. WAC 01325]